MVFLLAVETSNAIVNNVHHRSACAVVQPCFWNNVYALDYNRRSNAYVRLQKDAAILKMTSDDRLRTLSLYFSHLFGIYGYTATPYQGRFRFFLLIRRFAGAGIVS